MAVTILVLLFLECKRNVYKNRPLVTMRNYVHIHLCATLGIAQIIFVAGIEPQFGQGHLVGGVPLGCRLVAVLLHYWFLVSFMWMLMEGVVLYIALVRIFVSYNTRYIVAFTVASYGESLLLYVLEGNQFYILSQAYLCSMLVVSQYLWGLLGVRR